MKSIKQFEIHQIQLGPSKGAEQKGVRPCVVLQTNAASQLARTFLVAPLSSKKLEKARSYQVYVQKSKMNGLQVDSKVKCDQILVVDRVRFKQKIGQLEAKYIPYLFQAIDVMTDRWGDFRPQ